MFNKAQYLRKIDKVIEEGKYKANWDSLSKWEAPKWYRDAKFGIFIHWGIYSVPAFNNEWYSRNMYIQGSEEFNHHVETYGPHKEFGYKDFIPMFKAEKFDPEEWATLFEEAGAQYVIPVAEHHDGFQMYRSEISHWNAYEMGPHRDVLGELSQAVNAHGMENGASSHRVEHWFFMGHGREFDSDITDAEKEGDFYWPAMPEADHFDIHSKPTPTEDFLEDWLVRSCEIVDKFRPKVVYFDWWIQHESVKPYLKKFAAYYYNKAEQWGTGGVICYKHDAFMFGSAVVDIERGQFAEIKPFIWQTDTSISNRSWCHVEGDVFKPATEIIQTLVDIVSKNGRMLLNIGPRADGFIPEEQQKILLQIGEWLKTNGEAIYGSMPWRISGEGPTTVEEGQFKDMSGKNFTEQDIRYTVNGSCLYATVMKYPDNGRVTLTALGTGTPEKPAIFTGIVKSVETLGYYEMPYWSRNDDGLEIQTMSVQSERPVVFKIHLE